MVPALGSARLATDSKEEERMLRALCGIAKGARVVPGARTAHYYPGRPPDRQIRRCCLRVRCCEEPHLTKLYYRAFQQVILCQTFFLCPQAKLIKGETLVDSGADPGNCFASSARVDKRRNSEIFLSGLESLLKAF